MLCHMPCARLYCLAQCLPLCVGLYVYLPRVYAYVRAESWLNWRVFNFH